MWAGRNHGTKVGDQNAVVRDAEGVDCVENGETCLNFGRKLYLKYQFVSRFYTLLEFVNQFEHSIRYNIDRCEHVNTWLMFCTLLQFTTAQSRGGGNGFMVPQLKFGGPVPHSHGNCAYGCGEGFFSFYGWNVGKEKL